MRIATLQLASKLGCVDENIARADSLLSSSSASLDGLDILVLPELVFTGYNFPSLPSITPYLEPTAVGPSTQWAIRTARRLRCLVSVGYPELCSSTPPSPRTLKPTMIELGPERESYYTCTAYNSTVTVNPAGNVVAHYRKTHLYYSDEVWAQESPEGFATTDLDFPVRTPESISTTSHYRSTSVTGSATKANEPHVRSPKSSPLPTTQRTTFAICMDLNSYQFLPSSNMHPLSVHVLASSTSLLVLSTAWITSLPSSLLDAQPTRPDADTLSYWFERLSPLIQHPEKEFICVFANRCGEEAGKMHPNEVGEGRGVRYAGSSWVGKVGRKKVVLGGVLGRAAEEILVVDTEELDEKGWRVSFMEDG
ncbi:MAG: hypothetical protein Q9201_005181 [Fulgogasparrea decipioides]